MAHSSARTISGSFAMSAASDQNLRCRPIGKWSVSDSITTKTSNIASSPSPASDRICNNARAPSRYDRCPSSIRPEGKRNRTLGATQAAAHPGILRRAGGRLARANHWDERLSRVGRRHVPLGRAPVPRGTPARTIGTSACPTWDAGANHWYERLSRVGRRHVPLVRGPVPRGTPARTIGTRACPAWDAGTYHWYAGLSRVGRRHVPLVRAPVPRGTPARTIGTRACPAWDTGASQSYSGLPDVGRGRVPLVRGPDRPGTRAGTIAAKSRSGGRKSFRWKGIGKG